MSRAKKRWAVYQSISKTDYSAGFHEEPAGFVFAKDMREAARVFTCVYIDEGHWAKIVLADSD